MYAVDRHSIPGCVSQGRTEAEAWSNIAGAMREWLAVRAEPGVPATVATREIEGVVRGPRLRRFDRAKERDRNQRDSVAGAAFRIDRPGHMSLTQAVPLWEHSDGPHARRES